jgi:hypothetical protein
VKRQEIKRNMKSAVFARSNGPCSFAKAQEISDFTVFDQRVLGSGSGRLTNEPFAEFRSFGLAGVGRLTGRVSRVTSADFVSLLSLGS